MKMMRFLLLKLLINFQWNKVKSTKDFYKRDSNFGPNHKSSQNDFVERRYTANTPRMTGSMNKILSYEQNINTNESKVPIKSKKIKQAIESNLEGILFNWIFIAIYNLNMLKANKKNVTIHRNCKEIFSKQNNPRMIHTFYNSRNQSKILKSTTPKDNEAMKNFNSNDIKTNRKFGEMSNLFKKWVRNTIVE